MYHNVDLEHAYDVEMNLGDLSFILEIIIQRETWKSFI